MGSSRLVESHHFTQKVGGQKVGVWFEGLSTGFFAIKGRHEKQIYIKGNTRRTGTTTFFELHLRNGFTHVPNLVFHSHGKFETS